LLALLVDDDELSHEPEESAGVGSGVTCGDFVAIAEVDPDLEQVLALLFDVVGLEVVDNGQVVDVAAVS